MSSAAPAIAPSRGATATTVSQRIACAREPPWWRTNATALRPSAKSCAITATKTRTPVAVSTLNASPMPRPSMNVWIASAPAPSAPTCEWARALPARRDGGAPPAVRRGRTPETRPRPAHRRAPHRRGSRSTPAAWNAATPPRHRLSARSRSSRSRLSRIAARSAGKRRRERRDGEQESDPGHVRDSAPRSPVWSLRHRLRHNRALGQADSHRRLVRSLSLPAWPERSRRPRRRRDRAGVRDQGDRSGAGRRRVDVGLGARDQVAFGNASACELRRRLLGLVRRECVGRAPVRPRPPPRAPR